MSPDGKPTFYGLFTLMSASKFPCVHPAMTVAWGIRICEPCSLVLKLVSPKGKILHEFEPVAIQAEKECIIGGQHSLSEIEFPEPGEYKFRLIVDNRVLGDTPIVLSQKKGRSPDGCGT